MDNSNIELPGFRIVLASVNKDCKPPEGSPVLPAPIAALLRSLIADKLIIDDLAAIVIRIEVWNAVNEVSETCYDFRQAGENEPLNPGKRNYWVEIN